MTHTPRCLCRECRVARELRALDRVIASATELRLLADVPALEDLRRLRLGRACGAKDSRRRQAASLSRQEVA